MSFFNNLYSEFIEKIDKKFIVESKKKKKKRYEIIV